AFTLPQLANADASVSNSDLLGAPALLNVWATWCIACRAEHAYLNQLADSGITIYGLNYKDERDAATQWLARLGNPYRLNIFDHQGRLGLDLGVYGAPETYVLDTEGIIRYRHVGVMNEQVWRDKIVVLGIDWGQQAVGAM
ncbi:MAG: DsbE family thiol:disulfide interchange protein, partial [Pseudomonadales bacterium]|nr:DsbE family thiol:disulfide interchange protein [Pseudomonadales bacterium]